MPKCLYGEKLSRLGGYSHHNKGVSRLGMSPYLSSQSTAKFYFSSKRFVTLWKVDSPRVTWLGGRASTRPLPPGFCRSRRGIYGQSCRLPIACILHWSSLPNYRELDWGLKLFRKGEVFLIMIFNFIFLSVWRCLSELCTMAARQLRFSRASRGKVQSNSYSADSFSPGK